MKAKSIISALTLLIVISAQAAIIKEDVSFTSGPVVLKGTLFVPKGQGPFPAVVFVHGSGAETRENSFNSARWFASIGYAALAYDKRGAGESGGSKEDWAYFNLDTLAADVNAAVNFLKTKKIVDAARIGLHAASQGGWVAPLAAKSGNISFMIMKSASVTTIDHDRIFERSARLKKEGFDEQQIAEAVEMQKAEPKADSSPDNFPQLFMENKNKEWFRRVYAGDDPNTESLLKYRRWYGSVANFDPVPILESIDIPVFWIFGDPKLDELGPVSHSIQNVERLKSGGKRYELVSQQGEGHNVREKTYEKALYRWLCEVNGCGG